MTSLVERDPARPITLLFFGRSTLFGQGLDDPRQAWPHLVRAEIERELGRPVRVELRRFYYDGRDPSDYFRRTFEEVDPDLVTFTLVPYSFAVARVQHRLEQTFGARVGRLAHWMEARTTHPESNSTPGFVNRWSRRLAHRFIGVAPAVTRQQVEFTIDRACRFLARQERLAVVLREASAVSAEVVDANPHYVEVAAGFAEKWRREAERRHFYWSPSPPETTEFLRDAVHRTAAGHAEVAASAWPVMLTAIREVVLPELDTAGGIAFTRPAPGARQRSSNARANVIGLRRPPS